MSTLDPSLPLELMDRVIYFDEDRQPHGALVCKVATPTTNPNSRRERANLAVFSGDGYISRQLNVEPAYQRPDGMWVLLQKWAYPGEVPEDEWNFRPKPKQHFQGIVAHHTHPIDVGPL